jgi:hypothetical protein
MVGGSEALGQAQSSLSSLPVGAFKSIQSEIVGCTVCGGADNEHLIILCDGPGCNRETHIYCLWPPLQSVPEGQWLCDKCDPVGSLVYLQEYLNRLDHDWRKLKLQSAVDYQLHLESNLFPLDEWIPGLSPTLSDEFDISSTELLGNKVQVYCPLDQRYHIGRILSRRHDDQIGRWEHLVYFKR